MQRITPGSSERSLLTASREWCCQHDCRAEALASHAEAAARILAANNVSTERGPWELDLHGLHASEAVVALDHRLAGLWPLVSRLRFGAESGRHRTTHPIRARSLLCHSIAFGVHGGTCAPEKCGYITVPDEMRLDFLLSSPSIAHQVWGAQCTANVQYQAKMHAQSWSSCPRRPAAGEGNSASSWAGAVTAPGSSPASLLSDPAREVSLRGARVRDGTA